MSVDAEGFAREWARAQMPITTLVPSGKIRLSVPEVDTPPIPMIVVMRQGGTETYSDLSPRMIFEVWNVNKYEANLVASTIANQLCKVFALPPFESEGWTLNDGGEPNTLTLPSIKGFKRVQVETIMQISKGD